MLAQIQSMFAAVDLSKIDWNQFFEKYLEIAMSIIGKVIVSFLIIVIGFKLIKILITLLKTTLEKAEIDYGVISFSCSFIRIGLRCIVIFMAVAHMGVEVSSFSWRSFIINSETISGGRLYRINRNQLRRRSCSDGHFLHKA